MGQALAKAQAITYYINQRYCFWGFRRSNLDPFVEPTKKHINYLRIENIFQSFYIETFLVTI